MDILANEEEETCPCDRHGGSTETVGGHDQSHSM